MARRVALPAFVAVACASGECLGEGGACDAIDGGMSLLQHTLRKDRGAPRASSGRLSLFGAAQHPAIEWPGADMQPPMDDVYASFLKLDIDGKVMAAAEGDEFPKGYDKHRMPYSEHFQGVQRVGNHLFISGSGETEGKAQIFTIHMASRPESGPMAPTTDKSVHEGDALVHVERVDTQYWHVGGMMAFGHYLAVGAEAGCSTSERLLGLCLTASRVHFIDVSDPSAPKQLPYSIERPTKTAGAVALTQEADGRYLLLVGGIDSDSLDFYRTPVGVESLDIDPGFELVATWDKEALVVMAGVDDDYNAYQSMNFVRQADGTIFIIGTTRTKKCLGNDVADLFMLDNRQEDFGWSQSLGH